MPTYSISAPNGQTYQIDGPAGASQAQVQAEVMRQHPDAGTAPAKTAAGATGQAQGSPPFLAQALQTLAGPADAALSMARGAVAKPLGDLAGLGALSGMGLAAAEDPDNGAPQLDPAQIRQSVQQTVGGQPFTPVGQQTVGTAGKIADATLGSAARFAGNYYAGAAQKLGMPTGAVEAIRNGATEATMQAPTLIGALSAARASAVAKAAPAATNASEVLQATRKNGLLVSPTMAESQGGGPTGMLDRFAAGAASMSGSEVKMNQAMSRFNSGTQAPKIAAQDIGQTELTPKTLDDAKTEALKPSQAIKALGAGGPGTAPVLLGDDATAAVLKAKLDKIGVRDEAVSERYGSPNSDDITDLQKRLSPVKTPEYQAQQAQNQYQNIFPGQNPSQVDAFALSKDQPPITGQTDAFGLPPIAKFQPENPAAVVGMVQRLRDEARNLYKAEGDNTKLALADATKRAANALDEFLQTSLKKQGYGQLADSYVAGRTQLAKIHSIEDAFNAPAGTLNVASLARDLDNGVPLSGGLLDLANSYKAFPKAFQKAEMMPQTGNTSVLETAAMLASLKAMNLKTAALIASRPLSRAYAQTQGFQNRMVNGAPPPSPVPGAVAAGVNQAAPMAPQQAPAQ